MQIDVNRLPFEIRGKLLTTPEEALRIFGFVQHPDAVGIVIKKTRWGRLYIHNLMPYVPHKWNKEAGNKMKVLMCEWKKLPPEEKLKYKKEAEKQGLPGGQNVWVKEEWR